MALDGQMTRTIEESLPLHIHTYAQCRKLLSLVHVFGFSEENRSIGLIKPAIPCEFELINFIFVVQSTDTTKDFLLQFDFGSYFLH